MYIKMSQREASQLDISSCLRIISRLDRRLVEHPLLKFSPNDLIEDEDRTLLVLNWVALFFSSVLSKGYASCLSNDCTSVTLHIATSQDTPSAEDKEKARALLTIIKILMEHSDPALTQIQKLVCVYHYLMDNCWENVWSRINFTKTVISEAHTANRFGKALDAWSASRNLTKDQILSGDFADFEREAAQEGKSLKDAILSLFDSLLNISEPHSSDSDDLARLRYVTFSEANSICQKLNKAEFFKSFFKTRPHVDWLSSLTTTDQIAIHDLHRAIQGVLEYHVGAAFFIGDGIKYFRKFIGDRVDHERIENLINIVWVNHAMPIPSSPPQTWSHSPIQYLTSLRAEFRNQVQMKENGQKTALEHECANLWNVGDSMTSGGTLYAEVRMALYLRHHSIEVLHDAIGISVAPCISSARFLLGLGWQTRDESPVVRTDWLVPPEVHEEGKKAWVASAVTGVLGRVRKATNNVTDAFLIDHKAINLNNPQYKETARYTARDQPYVSGYFQKHVWEARYT